MDMLQDESSEFQFKIDAVFSLASEDVDDTSNNDANSDGGQTAEEQGSNIEGKEQENEGKYQDSEPNSLEQEIKSPKIEEEVDVEGTVDENICLDAGSNLPKSSNKLKYIPPTNDPKSFVPLIDILDESVMRDYIKPRHSPWSKVKYPDEEECKNFDVIFAADVSYERGQRKRKANVTVKGPEFTDNLNLRATKSQTPQSKPRPLKISRSVVLRHKRCYPYDLERRLSPNVNVDKLLKVVREHSLKPPTYLSVQVYRKQVARTKKKRPRKRLTVKRKVRVRPPTVKFRSLSPSPPRLEPFEPDFTPFVDEKPPVLEPIFYGSDLAEFDPSTSLSFSGRFRKRNRALDDQFVLHNKRRKVARVNPLSNEAPTVDDANAAMFEPVPTNPDPHAVVVPAVSKSSKPKTKKALNTKTPEFAAAVNELAKKENTKKFFQLRIGDKIVLIPTDGKSVLPKAFVMDAVVDVKSVRDTQDTNRVHSPMRTITVPRPTPYLEEPTSTFLTPLIEPKQEPIDPDESLPAFDDLIKNEHPTEKKNDHPSERKVDNSPKSENVDYISKTIHTTPKSENMDYISKTIHHVMEKSGFRQKMEEKGKPYFIQFGGKKFLSTDILKPTQQSPVSNFPQNAPLKSLLTPQGATSVRVKSPAEERGSPGTINNPCFTIGKNLPSAYDKSVSSALQKQTTSKLQNYYQTIEQCYYKTVEQGEQKPLVSQKVKHEPATDTISVLVPASAFTGSANSQPKVIESKPYQTQVKESIDALKASNKLNGSAPNKKYIVSQSLGCSIAPKPRVVYPKSGTPVIYNPKVSTVLGSRPYYKLRN